MSRKVLRYIIYVFFTLLVLWLVIPTKDFVAPTWDVTVVDQDGRPIDHAKVTEDFQQYTLESTGRELNTITDNNGHTQFEGRIIRANGLMRLVGSAKNLIGQGAHASFGIHTWISVSKAGYGEPQAINLFAQNERNTNASRTPAQSSKVILQKCQPGYGGFGCNFPNDPDLPLRPFDPSNK